MFNLSIAESALDSLGVVMQTTAHNIANVNTGGFKAQRVVLETGPHDEGVRVGAIYRDTGAVVNQDVDRVHLGNAADAWQVEEYRGEGRNSYNALTGAAIDNTVNLPREFANLTITENAYSAVAATIRAWDEMVGSIVNVHV